LNRSFFALFVALLIHLLFLVLFLILESFISKVQEQVKPAEKKIKISLKEMPKKHKDSGRKKEKVKPSIIAPPMPKGSQLKKIIKKPPIKYEPKKVIKTPKLNPKPKIEKQNPKLKKEPISQVKSFIPLVQVKKENNITKEKVIKKEPINPLYAMLSQDRSSQEEKVKKSNNSSSNNINQNIKKLYGEEFGKLSRGQQEYILDNQEIMRRITQQVLNRQASVTNLNRLNVNRDNTIEFYLHPNGDMSDFKFLHKSGYYVLDDITKATIDYAYSKYPRPKEKTLIRYNVFYNLRRNF